MVLEVVFPYEEVNFGRKDDSGRFSGLRYLFDQIERPLVGHARLWHVKNGRLTLRIPSLSLLDRLFAAVHGEKAHRFFYVNGTIGRDRMMKVRAKGVDPIGLSEEGIFFNDLQVWAHPFLYTLHDVFHGAVGTLFPLPMCRAAGRLYALSQAHLSRYPFTQKHLDRLSDLDPGNESEPSPTAFFDFSLSHFWTLLGEDLQKGEFSEERILQYPNYLSAYQRMLEQYPSQNPEVAFWQGQFLIHLRGMSDRLRGFLIRLIQESGNFR